MRKRPEAREVSRLERRVPHEAEAAHRADRGGRRTDEDEPSLLAGLGEVAVLREEAVPRVEGIGAGLRHCTQVLLGMKVARDLDDLVGRACMQRTEVVRRRDGDGLDSERATRAEDAHGDLTAIRDE